MKSRKSFSSGKSSGRGRSGGAKKTFGKGKEKDRNFSSPRSGAKPFRKRDDRDEKPYGDRAKPFQRSDERRDFKKPFDKKFSTGRAKPFGKRDDRDEKPYGDRAKPFQSSGDRKDFKKPFDKKFSTGRAKPFGKRDDRDEKPYGDRAKPFQRSGDRKDFKKPFDKKFSTGRAKPFGKRDDRDEKPYGDHSKSFKRSDDRKDFKKPFDKKFTTGRAKPFVKRDDRDEKPERDRPDSFDRSETRRERPVGKNFSDGRAKPFRKTDDRKIKPEVEKSEVFRPSDDGKDFVKHDERPKRKRNDDSSSDSGSKPNLKERKFAGKSREDSEDGDSEKKWNRKSGHEFYGDKKPKRNDRDKKTRTSSYQSNDDGSIRLNKFISNSGICSRREADELIAAGVVSVNGKIMTELGYKVQPGDEVKYNNETLRTEKLVYILVNKPKDFITTMDDPEDRKTVMWLIKDACRERVYPVGRLDRNTTGVLLFTNDGELAKKLTHPSFEIQKIYQVELDAPLKSTDMEKIKDGVTLEDGYIKVDDVAYSSVGQDKSVVGVEIHSGRNRIVRRLFENFGYAVKKLDRVYFAGLSKKDLPRGRWRFLTDLEVSNLKMMTGNKKMQKYFEA